MINNQEHSDLYDRLTVESCRRITSHFREQIVAIPADEPDREEKVRLIQAAYHIAVYYETGERAEGKAAFIKRLEERDQRLEQLVAKAEPRHNIRCLRCSQSMDFLDKHIYHGAREGAERVILFYQCPNDCKRKRAFFDDGEEFRPKPPTCERCHSPVAEIDERQGDVLITRSRCEYCGHESTFELDLSLKTKEPEIDEAFAADREQYCLTEKALHDYRREKMNMEQLAKLSRELEEKHKDAATNERMEAVRRLRVADLQEVVEKVLTTRGFIKIELSSPTNTDGLRIRLTALDGERDRSDTVAIKAVKDCLEAELRDTNWRLSKSSLTSTLGAVSGELRGYASETQLRELIEQENKANNSRKSHK